MVLPLTATIHVPGIQQSPLPSCPSCLSIIRTPVPRCIPPTLLIIGTSLAHQRKASPVVTFPKPTPTRPPGILVQPLAAGGV
jgi:hypothetical protein